MKRITALIGAAILGTFAFVGVQPSHAATILPFPKSLDSGRTLAINDTGADLITAWNSNDQSGGGADPGNCTNPRAGAITASGNSAVLSSNGSDCEYLQSPHTYPTVHGYVYEESVTVSQWTTWLSFWAYGNNWPTGGEIDTIEASPTGQNNISWHDSTTPPTGFSTCNNADGCDGNALPITNPSNAQQAAQGLAPGTHIIDFAFGGTGVINVFYDGVSVAFLQTQQAIGGSNDNPFWIDNSNGQAENGSHATGTFTVNYFRAWT